MYSCIATSIILLDGIIVSLEYSFSNSIVFLSKVVENLILFFNLSIVKEYHVFELITTLTCDMLI